MPETLSNRALCSLSDVKNYIGIELVDTTHDELLTRLINAATDDIYRYTGRDFKGEEEEDPETRAYDVSESRLADNSIAIHDAATITNVVVKTYDGTVRETTFAKVALFPRHRRSYEPITMIRIWELSCLSDTDYVEVTGTYGWPVIPEPIRQACIMTVSGWFVRDVRKFSETFVEEEEQVTLPRSLPQSVLDTLRSFQRPVVR